MKHSLKNKLPEFAADYRSFRLRRINEPQYRHLWLLLFWPIYWLRYPIIEAINPPERCMVVESIVDHWIPFNEWFLIPYMLWMALMLAIVVYTVLYDVESFKKYSKFLILTFSVSTVIYLIWPTCQNLRPETFPRDNFLTRCVGLLYAADTSTNVCPSEHVLGSIALWIAAAHTKSLRAHRWVVPAIGATSVVIILSTMFLKQHSFVDVVAALPLCAVAYLIVYARKPAVKTAVSCPAE